MSVCPHCSRANPAEALFCHHDGSPLREAMVNDPVRRRFAAPFIFPSGRTCWTFDELALACQDDFAVAVELLRGGALEAFMGGIGRHDLAGSAREAGRFFEAMTPGAEHGVLADRALDCFLGDLPARSLQPARLAVSPTEIDLGRLRVGQNLSRVLHLVNEGVRLLHGTVSSNAPWLVVGEGDGAPSKLFGCLHETNLCVQVRGRALRASLQPLVGKLTIASSGGQATVTIKAEALPQTFAAGVLSGARTPRQLAEKARLAPRESARLFETGAVARWYHDNGWTYPVEGASATGLAAVQQFFDALGVSAPPKLELSAPTLSLAGRSGEAIVATLRLSTVEKRPVYARAVSDQPWLLVSGIDLDGSNAHVRLSVPQVPDQQGVTLRATLTVTGNGRQRFTVPVSLRIAASRKAMATLTTVAASKATSPTAGDWRGWGHMGPGKAPDSDAVSPAPEWLANCSFAEPVPKSNPEVVVSTVRPAGPVQYEHARLACGPVADEPVLTPVRRAKRPWLAPQAVWLTLAALGFVLLLVLGVIIAH